MGGSLAINKELAWGGRTLLDEVSCNTINMSSYQNLFTFVRLQSILMVAR